MEPKDIFAGISQTILLLGVAHALVIALIYRVATKGVHRVISEILRAVKLVWAFFGRIFNGTRSHLEKVREARQKRRLNKLAQRANTPSIVGKPYGTKKTIGVVVREYKIKITAEVTRRNEK
ncbi:MAG: hypothetical protein JAY74_08780 [Candidatus Thiodiazotropha taylori]|nr:hypothetical protein [Candidatus Thiodiazotropha taylori]